MSIEALEHSSHTAPLETHDSVEATSPSHDVANNSFSDWGANAPATEPAAAAPQGGGDFDFFSMLGSLFGGGQNGQNTDLFSILSNIFDFAGDQAAQSSGANGGPSPQNPEVHRDEVSTGTEIKKEISGETGDEHLHAKGSADASIYAKANAFSETVNDGKHVKARAGAEARAGMQAEAQGQVTSDIGSIDGKARVSNEAWAAALTEAEAGPTGADAMAKAEAGTLAQAKADTNMNLGDGLVTGHAAAHAEAGGGANAMGKVGVSYAPPSAAVNAKAEAFAGARAGYAAQGGMAGMKYGIEGEVWAGIGAKAEFNSGIDKDGKLHFEFAVGVAYGVGMQIKYGMEIDLKQVAKTAGKILSLFTGGGLGAIASMFNGGKGGGQHANQAVTNAASQAAANAVGQAMGQTVRNSQHESSSFDGHSTSSSGSLEDGLQSESPETESEPEFESEPEMENESFDEPTESFESADAVA